MLLVSVVGGCGGFLGFLDLGLCLGYWLVWFGFGFEFVLVWDYMLVFVDDFVGLVDWFVIW